MRFEAPRHEAPWLLMFLLMTFLQVAASVLGVWLLAVVAFSM